MQGFINITDMSPDDLQGLLDTAVKEARGTVLITHQSTARADSTTIRFKDAQAAELGRKALKGTGCYLANTSFTEDRDILFYLQTKNNGLWPQHSKHAYAALESEKFEVEHKTYTECY